MTIKQLADIRSFIAGDATQIREVLHPKNGDPSEPYSLAHASLEPGQASLPHILEGSSEVYVIQAGTGSAYVNQVKCELRPGTVVHIPAGVEQYVVNEGEDLLQFWCIVSPPWHQSQELVVKP